MGKINIELDDETHKELKIRAINSGVLLKDYIPKVLKNLTGGK